jgi:hypothetical protein
MIHLARVLAAAEEIQGFLQKHNWRFCIIGGVAIQRWGEPRMTRDVDLLTGIEPVLNCSACAPLSGALSWRASSPGEDNLRTSAHRNL